MTLDPNLLVALTIIVGQIITAILAWQTRSIAQKTELNTNSMKDALVKSTMDSAHAAGREEGRVEGEKKAAAVAEGVAMASAVPATALPIPVEVVNTDNPVPVKIKRTMPRKGKPK